MSAIESPVLHLEFIRTPRICPESCVGAGTGPLVLTLGMYGRVMGKLAAESSTAWQDPSEPVHVGDRVFSIGNGDSRARQLKLSTESHRSWTWWAECRSSTE